MSNPPKSGCTDKAWFGWPCDERLETLRRAWAHALDPAEQKRLATKIQLVAYDSVPFVLTGQYFTIRAYRKNIKGVIASPVPAPVAMLSFLLGACMPWAR